MPAYLSPDWLAAAADAIAADTTLQGLTTAEGLVLQQIVERPGGGDGHHQLARGLLGPGRRDGARPGAETPTSHCAATPTRPCASTKATRAPSRPSWRDDSKSAETPTPCCATRTCSGRSPTRWRRCARAAPDPCPSSPSSRPTPNGSTDRSSGAELERFRALTFTALKTVAPAPEAAVGSPLTRVSRVGKYLLAEVGALTLRGAPHAGRTPHPRREAVRQDPAEALLAGPSPTGAPCC